MAQNRVLEYESCVRWTTGLPCRDVPCKSPYISIGQDSGWYLELATSDTVSRLYLRNDVDKKLKRPFRVTTYVQDSTKRGLSQALSQVTRVHKSGVELWSKSNSSLADLIGNIPVVGKVSIICSFEDSLESGAEFLADRTDASTETDSAYQHLQHLSRDFGSLLKDGTLSDVELKCGDSTFSAHKSVLAARSEVFAAMFRNEMAESVTGVVDVQDLEPGVLEQLLKYMYTGEIPDLCRDIAPRLYEAADRYAVLALKKECSEYMLENMKEENCLDLLVLADQHGDKHFKKAIVRVVATHFPWINRATWSAFKEEHVDLAMTVLAESFLLDLTSAPRCPFQ